MSSLMLLMLLLHVAIFLQFFTNNANEQQYICKKKKKSHNNYGLTANLININLISIITVHVFLLKLERTIVVPQRPQDGAVDQINF